MLRSLLLRWVVLWLVAMAVPLLALRVAYAASCEVPALRTTAVRAVVQRWSRPGPEAETRPLWAALLPTTISWQLRDSDYDGNGWYLSPTTGTSSHRSLLGLTRSWAISARWQIGALFDVPPSRAISPLARLDRIERLVNRLAVQARALATIGDRAGRVVGDSRDCLLAQRQAAAVALAIEGLLGPRSNAVRWPNSKGTPRVEARASRWIAVGGAPISSRRQPGARPAPRSATLQPPGPGPPR